MRRPTFIPYFRWIAVLSTVLVLVQAFLAGRGLSLNHKFIDYHGMLANAIFLIVVVQLVLLVAIGIPGIAGKRLVAMNAVLVLLVLMQTGLGYSGRTDMDARAWHIPLGVLIFGLTVAIAGMTWPMKTEER